MAGSDSVLQFADTSYTPGSFYIQSSQTETFPISSTVYFYLWSGGTVTSVRLFFSTQPQCFHFCLHVGLQGSKRLVPAAVELLSIMQMLFLVSDLLFVAVFAFCFSIKREFLDINLPCLGSTVVQWSALLPPIDTLLGSKPFCVELVCSRPVWVSSG